MVGFSEYFFFLIFWIIIFLSLESIWNNSHIHSFIESSMETIMTDLFSWIKIYFELGLRHWEIVLSLSHIDGFTISLSTLRRHLRTLRLFRRKAHSDLLDIAMFLQDQLDRYGVLHVHERAGRSHYRPMGVTCRIEVLVGVWSIAMIQKKSEKLLIKTGKKNCQKNSKKKKIKKKTEK